MTEQRLYNLNFDTWSYFWLVIGGILLVFSNGIWKVIPLYHRLPKRRSCRCCHDDEDQSKGSGIIA